MCLYLLPYFVLDKLGVRTIKESEPKKEREWEDCLKKTGAWDKVYLWKS